MKKEKNHCKISQVDEDFIKKGENSSKKYESANSERILVNEENTTNDCNAETLLQHHDKNDCSTSKTRETLLVEDGNDKVQSTPSELFNGETTDKLIRREDNVLLEKLVNLCCRCQLFYLVNKMFYSSKFRTSFLIFSVSFVGKIFLVKVLLVSTC